MSFGLKILSVEAGNTIISPLNIAHAFSILLNGASSNTKTRIEQLLSPLDKAGILSSLSNVPSDVAIAARLFLGDKFKIKSEFTRANEESFGSVQSENLNFAAARAAADRINSWVAESTDNKITDLVSAGDFDPLTRLVILSTIVFKGLWKEPFSDTFQAKFDDKIMTTFMSVKQKGVYGVNVSDEFSACDIPYVGDGGLKMTIIMPQGNLETFESTLTEEGLNKIFSEIRMQRGDVTLTIPKFKMEKKTNLKNTFTQLGFGDLFDQNGKHDYSPLTDEDIFLADAIHSATIEVDEKGTVATAATALKIQLLMMVRPVSFTADRPFLYFIRQNETVLFMGRFSSA